MPRHCGLKRNAARPTERSATDYAKARRYNFRVRVLRRFQRGLLTGSEACAPRFLTNKIRTRSAIARASPRFSRLLARPAARSSIGPAKCALARQTNLI